MVCLFYKIGERSFATNVHQLYLIDKNCQDLYSCIVSMPLTGDIMKGVISMSNSSSANVTVLIDKDLKKNSNEFQRRLDDFDHNKNIVYKTLEDLKEMEQ